MTSLLIETSSRGGLVGLVRDGVVVQSAVLEDARRHARDLAQTIRKHCADERIAPRDIGRVVVGIGPGSYTGLRVGIASAKSFAFALGCELVAVPTFHAIIERLPPHNLPVDVVSDALQGMVYVQRFIHSRGKWQAIAPLHIGKAAAHEFAPTVVGPWLASEYAQPTLESLWVASQKLNALSKNQLFELEPLYLRGSSAEEARKAQSAVSASIAS